MSKYIGVTIGPIIESLVNARKTMETWGASFVFSWLMWRIVRKIYDNRKYENIVLPYRDKLQKKLRMVGLYPDHLIYKCDGEHDDLDMGKIIEEVKGELNEWLKKLLGEKLISGFVENYFQIQYFTVELDEEQLKREGKNFQREIDDIFYSLELQGNLREETRALSRFINTINKTRCPSLIEIATVSFTKKTYWTRRGELTDEKAKKLLAEKVKDDNFKSYHKYVAVVQCDGDNLGKFNRGFIDYYTRENVGKCPEDAIRKVSNCLFDWGEEASRKITAYGGLPVYAGGDDLLFFAPVVGKGEGEAQPTLVQLLKSISDLFRGKMKGLAGNNESITLPTLSFGVCIFYYKYPLGEAQQRALNLLEEMKKKHGRNGMNISLLKHSGSGFSVTMHFDALRYNERYCWESVFEALMELNQEQMSEQIISATAYKLQQDQKLFDYMQRDEKRIRQYFLHNMEGFPKEEFITTDGKWREKEGEEKVHFLLEVEKLVKLAYLEKKVPEKRNGLDERMRAVFDMLRFVKFLKGLDKKD